MIENEKNKVEVELRGKVIALSLRLEDALTRMIYNFFYPKASDEESKRIFLEEFIFQLTFNKKKEILKKIYKTDRYKNILIDYIKSRRLLEDGKSIRNYDEHTRYVIKLLTEIISERNIIAHGNDITRSFSALDSDEVVLANKSKFYKFSKKSLAEYSDKISTAYLLLNIVEIKR